MISNIVVVLSCSEIKLWQFEVIQSLVHKPELKLHLLILPASESEAYIPAGFEIYSKLDENFFSKKLSQENAKGVKSLQDIPSNVLRYHSIEELPAALNLAISLEPNQFPFEKNTIPADEYWFAELSDGAAVPGFDEIYDRSSSLRLRILSSKSSKLFDSSILYGSTTALNTFSCYETINPCLWKLRHAFSRLLNDYLQGSARLEKFHKSHAETIAVRNFGFEKQKLTNLKFFLLLVKVLCRFFAHKVRSFTCHEQFVMAYRKRGTNLLSQGNLDGFRLIEPPASQFWADPFLFIHQKQTWLFFENLEFSNKVGKLSVLNLSDLEAGHPAAPMDILVTPYHLSYPQIFEDKGQIYMLPETTGNNALELYQAEDFPLKWKKAGNLLDNVKAHDATILKKEGLYWLFANMEAKNAPFNDELSLFSSDSLQGEWSPHPQNPIVTLVESARSGGRIHFDGEKLLRPSQDCSVCYGYGLNFNEIIVLNQTYYSETLVEKITPFQRQGFHAIHSYDVNDDYEVVDMARYTPKISIFKLFSAFSKLVNFRFSIHFKINKKQTQSALLDF